MTQFERVLEADTRDDADVTRIYPVRIGEFPLPSFTSRTGGLIWALNSIKRGKGDACRLEETVKR